MRESSRPPSRLFDQVNSPLLGALLQAGMDVHVSSATRASLLETLGLERTVMFAQAKPRILTFRRGAFLLAAMVVSAAAVAVPLVRGRLSTGASVAGVGSQRLLSPAKVDVSSVPQAGLVPVPEAQPTVQEAKASRAAEEPGSARGGTHLSGRNALAAELAALDAVRGKLNAGEPRAAQQLLEAYQRDFPKARLALEAEVLRIDALDRAGQSEAARKRAAAFIQAHPKGVLTGRVRRYLQQ
jgi:hypothetical protein